MKKTLLLSTLALLSVVSRAQNVPPSYVPLNGLAGWWPLDSNANDVSPNTNNGVAMNVVYTTDRFSRPAKAAGFNGANSLIDITEKPSQKVRQITMSAWAYSNVSRYSQIIYKGQLNNAAGENYSFNNQSMFLKINSSCQPGNGWQGCYYPSVLPTYSWVHVCATYDGTRIRNYINGQLVSDQALNGLIDTCSSNLRIGYGHNNGGTGSGLAGDAWDGKLDDVGLWNRALDYEEVIRLYQGSLVVPPPPPPPAGIGADEKKSTIAIWPNPAGEQVSIEGANLAGSTVFITNMMGQLVWSAKSSSSLLKIDRVMLGASGIYFVKITNPKDELIQMEKLMLQ